MKKLIRFLSLSFSLLLFSFFFLAPKNGNAQTPFITTMDCKFLTTLYREDHQLVEDYLEENYPNFRVEYNPQNAWNDCYPLERYISFVIRDFNDEVKGEILVSRNDDMEVKIPDSISYFFQKYWRGIAITALALIVLNIFVTKMIIHKRIEN